MAIIWNFLDLASWVGNSLMALRGQVGNFYFAPSIQDIQFKIRIYIFFSNGGLAQ